MNDHFLITIFFFPKQNRHVKKSASLRTTQLNTCEGTFVKTENNISNKFELQIEYMNAQKENENISLFSVGQYKTGENWFD